MSSPNAVCVSGHLCVCISGVMYMLLLKLQLRTWGGGIACLHLRSPPPAPLLASWQLRVCPACSAHTRAGWGVDGGRAACLLPSDSLWSLSMQRRHSGSVRTARLPAFGGCIVSCTVRSCFTFRLSILNQGCGS